MPVIAQKGSRAYAARVSLRLLFAMLIAAAMLFAPLAAQGGTAMAAQPTSHHGEMMQAGHCADQPAQGDHQKAPEKSCCIAMCMAIAVVSSTPFEAPILIGATERPSPTRFHPGFLAELPTPPPRLV